MIYTIQAVSPQQKNWRSDYGEFTTYYIRLEGETDNVELNKKADSAPPVEGEQLDGEITETQYGKRLKVAKKAFGGGGYSRDDAAIKAQWAIGQSMTWHKGTAPGDSAKLPEVEKVAKQLFAMVERVKQSLPEAKASSEAPKPVKTPEKPSQKLDTVHEDDEEKINLDNIPF